MSATTTRILLPGIHSWFDLTRHDDDPADPQDPADPADDPQDDPDDDPADPQDPADPADDPQDDPDDDPDPDGLSDAGRKALERMKAERATAKKEAAQAKLAAAAERRKAAALAKKVEEFEDRDKTELQKATAQADRAKDQATRAVARSVKSEIKVLASGQFADLTDATDALMGDLSKYVDEDGEVDTAAIEADLADLLERKPHWAAPAAQPQADGDPQPETKPKKQRPQPDPGQGSRTPAGQTDWTKAPTDEFNTELQRLGVRPRR